MSSRALIPATVMLLVACLAAERALAQATNLEAGKTPSQIFAGTCNACHKAPRGLLKTVPPSSLSGFLRQHYTTSPEMAGVLASYLISNGATDTRVSGGDKKGAREGTKEAKQEAKPPEQLDRWGRRVHPGGAPSADATPVPSGEAPQSPGLSTIEAAKQPNAKQKLSKRGKPEEELPRGEGPKETPAPGESGKPEGVKPAGESPSQSANAAPTEAPTVRPDPVPPVTAAPAASPESTPVTPAPAAPAASAEPAPAAPPPASSVISAAISAETAPAVPSPSKPVDPPAVAAAPPPLPPVPPAGPPAPPISR